MYQGTVLLQHHNLKDCQLVTSYQVQETIFANNAEGFRPRA